MSEVTFPSTATATGDEDSSRKYIWPEMSIGGEYSYVGCLEVLQSLPSTAASKGESVEFR